MKKKSRPKRDFKKMIFSIIVILIVLSFAASFFASGISARSASAATQPPAEPTPVEVQLPSDEATPIPTPTVDVSAFLASIKASMVATDDASANAALIYGAVNVYNSLYPSDMILDDETLPNSAIEKLKNAGIYFDEIDSGAETTAWSKVSIDENGKATVK